MVPTTIADREQEPLSASPRSSRDPFTKSFDSFVQETIDEWKVAGVAIAVVDGDEIFSKVGPLDLLSYLTVQSEY